MTVGEDRFARSLLRGEPAAEAARRVLEAESRFHRRFAALDPPSRTAARLKRRAVAAHRAAHRISLRLLDRLEQGATAEEAFAAELPTARRASKRLDPVYRRLGLPACTEGEFELLVRGNL